MQQNTRINTPHGVLRKEKSAESIVSQRNLAQDKPSATIRRKKEGN